MAETLAERVLRHIRDEKLLRPGHRVAVAVSGGSDSVALLRLLLQLRGELGLVLSVAHFQHKIRPDSADDEAFVAALAREFGLEFYRDEANIPEHAAREHLSIETAARRLRYDFFTRLLAEGKADVIATGHTADDQAETVLHKFLRGAGTRGLGGIYPRHAIANGELIRPLLPFRHSELQAYANEVGQPWREDLSNLDLRFTRNKLRHGTLPLLEREANPAIFETLAHTADWARAEEQYWQAEMERLLPTLVLLGRPVRGGGRSETATDSVSLSCETLARLPLAVQRRALRALAASKQLRLDFAETERLRALAVHGSRDQEVQLHIGWRAVRGDRELTLAHSATERSAEAFDCALVIPGETPLPHGSRLRITIANGAAQGAAYNRRSLMVTGLDALRARNWRAGDRFWPAHVGSEKKVKELLQPLKLAAAERACWPVVVDASAKPAQVLWLRGFKSPRLELADGRELLIEETR